MVDERKDALERVQAQRAAYRAQLLDWFGNRAGAFALAAWLLLMAVMAAAWRPLLAWLALQRARGLDAASYAKAVVVGAASLAGGAAAAVALFATFNGVLAPVAVPVIAAMAMLLGLTAWHSTAATVRSGALRFRPTGRLLLPGMATGLTFLAGLGIGITGLLQEKPAEPRVSPRTAALARLAEDDPTASPTKRVARLRRRADRAAARSRRAEARVAAAEAMLRDSEDDVTAATDRVSKATVAVDRWQRLVGASRR